MARITPPQPTAAQLAADPALTSTFAPLSWGEWESYVPVFNSSGADASLGDGTIVGSYAAIGETIIGRVSLTCGATTNFGTGNPMFSLPTAIDVPDLSIVGAAAAFEAGVGAASAGPVLWLNSFNKIWLISAGATVPFTFGTGDFLSVQFTYKRPAA